jgi:4-hydroxy-3-polyprenylbenzoate decarboxylase
MTTNQPLVVAITGASGVVYAVRLVRVLLNAGRTVLLTISPSGQQVLREEMQIAVDLDNFDRSLLLGDEHEGELEYFHYRDFLAPIASGSHLTGGMVVCPCSGSTLSAIAHAGSNNLIHRAADVHLKERRKLILVPRETPLSLLQLENMRRACEAGAVILPAMPGWYHGVRSVEDLIDFVVARLLDQLGVPHSLMKRWGEED